DDVFPLLPNGRLKRLFLRGLGERERGTQAQGQDDEKKPDGREATAHDAIFLLVETATDRFAASYPFRTLAISFPKGETHEDTTGPGAELTDVWRRLDGSRMAEARSRWIHPRAGCRCGRPGTRDTQGRRPDNRVFVFQEGAAVGAGVSETRPETGLGHRIPRTERGRDLLRAEWSRGHDHRRQELRR